LLFGLIILYTVGLETENTSANSLVEHHQSHAYDGALLVLFGELIQVYESYY